MTETFVSPDSAMDENKVLLSSWLLKRSHKTHQWQKRWVVLRNCQISYYKNASEHKPSKVINKHSVLSFSSVADGHKNHFAVYTSNKVIHWKTDDTNTYHQWMNALDVFISGEGETKEKALKNLPPIIIPSSYNTPPNSGSLQRPTTSFATETEYSGADDHLSSGVSDSQMSISENYPSPLVEEAPKNEPGPLEPVLLDQEEYIVEQGYLLRLHKRYNQWRRFYVLLTSHKLYFYKSQNDFKRPIKTISLKEVVDVIELDPLLKTKVWCMLIITPSKRLRFCADSEQDLLKWLSAIKTMSQKQKK